jgi:ATP-binding protein involved in chromosome partitioning
MKRILISSSKGGVGKTTVTVNLAKELNRRGVKVGILDADIVAPNVPYLLGFTSENRPRMEYVEDRLIPVEKDGIKVVSYWFELDKDIPVLLWGTQRVDAILSAFCREVKWGGIDVLLVDCPPTTADEIVGLTKMLGHIEGAILVVQGNTRLSIEDAKLSKSAFEYLNIKILGIVQNMISEYFDDGIDAEKELGLRVLAKIPLGDLSKISDLADFVEKEVLER